MVPALKREPRQAFQDNSYVVVGAAAVVLSSIDERKLGTNKMSGRVS